MSWEITVTQAEFARLEPHHWDLIRAMFIRLSDFQVIIQATMGDTMVISGNGSLSLTGCDADHDAILRSGFEFGARGYGADIGCKACGKTLWEAPRKMLTPDA